MLMAVSSPDLKAFLVATPFFGGLSDASLDLLISMLVERRFDVGASVVAEGEPGRSMYIVHSGELVVSKLGESGRVIDINRLGPGDFFGERGLLDNAPRNASVTTSEPGSVLRLEGTVLLDVLSSAPMMRSAIDRSRERTALVDDVAWGQL